VFLVAGAGDRPVEYRVERLREGSSFATRRVVGAQGGRPIVSLTASFHRPEGEALHQRPAPAWAGGPTGLAPGRYDSTEVDCRDIPPATGSTDPLELGHWLRVRGELPDDPSVAEAALAWVSDNGPTRAARQPHLDHPGFARVRTTSLDHHLWFHRPTALDRVWHVAALRSSATADARGLVNGTIHDADGRHVATVAQEVLVRLPT
jgi:acyl-CoA thioesterase-2